MKIIKKGSEKTHRVTCEFCNSDLEYTDDDVFFKKVKGRGGLIGTRYSFFKGYEEYAEICMYRFKYITCPVCHNNIKLTDVDSLLSGESIGWEKVL